MFGLQPETILQILSAWFVLSILFGLIIARAIPKCDDDPELTPDQLTYGDEGNDWFAERLQGRG